MVDINNPRHWPRERQRSTYYNELSLGESYGYQWYTAHNDIGYRNGYVRIPRGHTWWGKSLHELGDVNVHGSITWAKKGTPRMVPRFSYQWWIGFDCAHSGDAPDTALMSPDYQVFHGTMNEFIGDEYGQVRSQEYVEIECIYLCQQAHDLQVKQHG